jgi:glycosidase
MDGHGGNHSEVRKDFPGGWAADPVNAFSQEGRTTEQNEMYDFMKKLLNWRKEEAVIHNGKLTHYIPEDNIYVYFRSNERKTIMVVLNGNPSEKQVDVTRFQESVKGATRATDMLTGNEQQLNALKVPAHASLILELR